MAIDSGMQSAEGNPKTLRHKFAVYCDDICAWADTLEELYELFEALICCCKRAGIQVKASKTKFGMDAWIGLPFTITPSLVKERNQRMPTFAPSGTCLLSLMFHRCELF